MSDNHLLSLSRAARLVGVDRRTLQADIQAGRLATFEGRLRLEDLCECYPDAASDTSGMLEKVRRIKASACAKPVSSSLPSAEVLAGEVHRLRLRLVEQEQELARYRQLTTELNARLHALQRNCDRKQKIMLQTVLAWFAHELKKFTWRA